MPSWELTIVGCSGLVSDVSPINPFCTIQFEGNGYGTDPCIDTPDPVWGNTFTLTVTTDTEEKEYKAHVCIWNRTPSKDLFLGDYWLTIDKLQAVHGSPTSHKVPLGKCKGTSELHVVVTALDFGEESSKEDCFSQKEEFADTNKRSSPTAPSQAPCAAVVVPSAPRTMQPPTTTKGIQLPPTTGRVLIRSSTYGTNLRGHNGDVSTSQNTRAYEVWNISTSTDGRYIFQSHDGEYLHGNPKCAVNTVPTCEDGEKWSIEPHPVVPSAFIIVSHHGTCLQAERCGGLLGLSPSSSQTVSLASKPVEGDMWEIVSLSGSGVDVGGGVSTTSGDNGGRYVSIRSCHNTYLHGHGGKISASSHEEAASRKTTWTVNALGDGKYSLRSQDGTYLRADPKLLVNTASVCQDWEKWYIEAHPIVPGKASIRSAHGTFLRADGRTVDLAVRPLEWEAWDIIPV